ncbi:unnamed protein product [Caenorhabditis auriculariae]|uniref:ADF-H domain-containing protein n=1 Tax=Caenorhabditis auriculariae TaxID=2777116 RepID=A0A8S1HTX7_9PELO|nr:unnamed protein product [Caenorhabditis auriculariae]
MSCTTNTNTATSSSRSTRTTRRSSWRKVGEKAAPYSEFVEELKKLVEGGKECRYAAVDVEVTVQRQGAEGASKLSKVIFVQYCPDEAPVRRRMLYASSVRALKASLGLESLFQVQSLRHVRPRRESHQERPDGLPKNLSPFSVSKKTHKMAGLCVP